MNVTAVFSANKFMFEAYYKLLARAGWGLGTHAGLPNMGMPKSHHRSSLAVHVIVGDYHVHSKKTYNL